MRKSIVTSIVLCMMLSLFLAGCGKSADTSAPGKTNNSGTQSEAPKATAKQLTMYTAFPEQEVVPYLNAFEKQTGIKVKFVRLSAGETLARLQAEKNNPQASIWYGGPSDTFVAAIKEGVLEPYQPAGIEVIPERYRDQQGYWAPVYVGPLGFASNTEWLQKHNLKAPESWEDLIKPEFKGQIVVAHPGASGTAYSILATLVQMWGEDKAFDYLKKLDENVLQYQKSGSGPPKQVGLGEGAIGIAFAHDILKPKGEGYPLELTFPSEGTGFEIGAIALIKGGPEDEREIAKQFIDWSISKEAQDLYASTKSFRLPINPDAEVAEGAARIDELKVMDYDEVWAGEHRKELLAKFESTIKGQDAAK